MKKLRIMRIGQETQGWEINLSVWNVLEYKVGQLFWHDLGTLIIQVIPTKILKGAGACQQYIHCGCARSILRRLLGVFLVFDGVTVCRIRTKRRAKQRGEKADKTCNDDLSNGGLRHVLNFLANDERMHHYQRRRTSITGLVL